MSLPSNSALSDEPPPPSSPATDVARAARPPRAAAWLREPLLHFTVLGALLFALDHALLTRRDDPRTIVVGAQVDREAREVFKAARGVEPDATELAALRRVWLDNEVLYREGMALRVDQGDTAIRERVIFKALNLIEADLKLPPVDDQALRNWFEAHRDKYDEPARVDFQEAALAGDGSESAVRAFVTELNTGVPGDARAALRVFKGRPQSNLVQSYGAEFDAALQAGPVGEWRAMRTREGWRAVRLDAIAHPKPAAFEPLRNAVLQDWTDATMAELRTAAVRALAGKYTVTTEGVLR